MKFYLSILISTGLALVSSTNRVSAQLTESGASQEAHSEQGQDSSAGITVGGLRYLLNLQMSDFDYDVIWIQEWIENMTASGEFDGIPLSDYLEYRLLQIDEVLLSLEDFDENQSLSSLEDVNIPLDLLPIDATRDGFSPRVPPTSRPGGGWIPANGKYLVCTGLTQSDQPTECDRWINKAADCSYCITRSRRGANQAASNSCKMCVKYFEPTANPVRLREICE